MHKNNLIIWIPYFIFDEKASHSNPGKTRQGMTRHGKARPGEARRGGAQTRRCPPVLKNTVDGLKFVLCINMQGNIVYGLAYGGSNWHGIYVWWPLVIYRFWWAYNLTVISQKLSLFWWTVSDKALVLNGVNSPTTSWESSTVSPTLIYVGNYKLCCIL